MDDQMREVSLVQLFWKVMLKWKIWILSAIIFAVLLPGVKYVKDVYTYQTTQNVSEEDVEAAVFTKEEQQQIDDVKDLQQLLDKQRNYMENSVLMNIDPYQECVLKLQYYVNSDYKVNYTRDNELDYTSAITNAYVAYANDGMNQKDIWVDFEADLEEKYIAELISAESVSDDMFIITVKYSDMNALEKISKSVQKNLNEQTQKLSGIIGSHRLVLVSENILTQTDMALADSQKKVADLVNNYRTQITTLTSSMSEEQMKAVEQDVAKDADKDVSVAEEELQKPGLSKKYVVLGFLAGLFLAVMVLVCIDVMSNKLQAAEELVDYFKLRQFGILVKDDRARGINGFILHLKYRNQKQLTTEASLMLAISNIELYCKNENITELFLTGSEIERVNKDWINMMVNALKEQGIHAVYGENICYDGAAMRKASESGHVVLLEITDVSLYTEIEKEIRMLKDWNVNLIGCVGIE